MAKVKGNLRKRHKGISPYSARAAAGGRAVRNKYGRGYFAYPLGSRGGKRTLTLHHRSHFVAIGAIGGRKSKRPPDREAKHPHAKRNLR